MRIVNIRVDHKLWDADKIRAILKREHISPLPGRTTIPRVLKQADRNQKMGKGSVTLLTIRNSKSRFILQVTLLPDSKEESVRQAMIEVFKRYGLPKSIRSNNGTPFACTQALLRLSKLSVWRIRLGIEPNRGRVGRPQDYGAHERMHKDMKRELQAELADTPSEMDEWVHEFNTIRPYQALKGDTPA